MASTTLRAGWDGISLTGLGLRDTRAVEVIGEQLFVSDGADASVRIAQMMSEFASRMTGAYRGQAAPGINAVREYGASMTMLTSGLLAGFADALRQQSESKKTR